MYALSANYGGLIARMIFQPIEVSSRNLFANLCATSSQESNGTVGGTVKEKSDDETTKRGQDIQTAANTLHDILHAYSILSLFAFAIGPPLAPLLLRLVAGSRWTDSGAGEVLGIYCYYIPFLAINGVSEAFVAATASTTELHQQSLWMTGFSVLFAASAYVFLRVLELGAKGLVLANCVNMGLRIVFNLYFVKQFFGRQHQAFNISAASVNMYAVAVAISIASFIPYSGDLTMLQRYGLLGDIGRIGAVGFILLMTVVVTEREFLRGCYDRFSS
jgi:oligosaccharide translocation protein RFT1